MTCYITGLINCDLKVVLRCAQIILKVVFSELKLVLIVSRWCLV